MSSLYRRLSLWLRRNWRNVLRAEDSPRSVAGGVAIGVICGFMPFFGLKTVLAVGVAWLFRCSRIGAVVAVTLYDVMLPFAPLLLRWEYKIGSSLLQCFGVERPPFSVDLSLLHWRKLLDWEMIRTGLKEAIWPLCLGGLILAIPVALLAYFFTLTALRAHRAKRDTLARQDEPQASE